MTTVSHNDSTVKIVLGIITIMSYKRVPKLKHCKTRERTDLSIVGHDSNGCFLHSGGNLVLNDIEHVLVIEQTDEVKRTEAGGATQSQVTNHH